MKKRATLALGLIAAAASAGTATAAPLPAGPAAFRTLTGLVLPGPDENTGSNVNSGSPILNVQDTNGLNLMSDHSRTQTAGTSANQG